jgi:hypothetical protein
MGNRKAREFVQRQEREAAWNKARTEPRSPTRDVPVDGARRLQLIPCPAFTDGCAWEIRRCDDDWLLYRSRTMDSPSGLLLIGYEQQTFGAASLASFFNRIVALRFPAGPLLAPWGGADGTTWQLAIFGDLYSECRFQWWSCYPPAWHPMVQLAEEMLTAFSPDRVSELGGARPWCASCSGLPGPWGRPASAVTPAIRD